MSWDAGGNSRLFLAVLPDAATAIRIHRLAGRLKRAHNFSGRLIAPNRLHVSLFFLGGLPEHAVIAACKAVSEVRMPSFDISFDRTASFHGPPGSRPFVLIGSSGLNRLKSFRQALGARLAQQGLRRRANTNFEPHVTLLYDDRSAEEYPVAEPICWTINEIVLVHSVGGHSHLAKWRLLA